MKYKILLISILIMTSLSACATNEECPMPDRVTQVKSFEINHHPYFIYLRVTGTDAQDVYYELYDNVPVFDRCGKADLAAVTTARVDPAAGNIDRLLINGLALSIEYRDDGVEAVDLEKIPLEIKRR